MRRFKVAIAATLAAELIATGAPARAQEPAWNIQTPAAGLDFYAPIVWYGNALDQKILDAQAEMIALHRPIRHPRQHRRG